MFAYLSQAQIMFSVNPMPNYQPEQHSLKLNHCQVTKTETGVFLKQKKPTKNL